LASGFSDFSITAHTGRFLWFFPFGKNFMHTLSSKSKTARSLRHGAPAQKSKTCARSQGLEGRRRMFRGVGLQIFPSIVAVLDSNKGTFPLLPSEKVPKFFWRKPKPT
jgi:hypothetical protein